MKFDSVQQVIPSMRPTDFMHIDVQGAELLVLQGAKKELERTTAIWIEVSTRELYQRQALVMDIMRFIKSLGFKKTIDTLKPGVAQGDQFWSKI